MSTVQPRMVSFSQVLTSVVNSKIYIADRKATKYVEATSFLLHGVKPSALLLVRRYSIRHPPEAVWTTAGNEQCRTKS